MIPKCTMYALVRKATGLIEFKGSKKAMVKRLKASPGQYFLGFTTKPLGIKYFA